MSVRDKGNAFERKVAEQFTNKFNTNFRRTPLSGGFDKSVVQGDIFTTDRKFSLVIECKNHKRFTVPDWWKQVLGDTPRWKVPLLIMYFSGLAHKNTKYYFKKTQHGEVVLLRSRDFEKLSKNVIVDKWYMDNKLSMPKYLNDLYNEGHKVVGITSDVLTGRTESYILLTLDTFFDSIYVNRCFKRIIAIKNRQTN